MQIVRKIRLLGAAVTVAAAWMLAPPGASAALVADFDAPGTPWAGANYPAPNAAPVPFVTGPAGAQFLRLKEFSGLLLMRTDNTVGFDQTDPGPITRMTADFDFRITCGGLRSGFGCADGFSLVLLNTAVFGTSGAPFALDEAGRSGAPNPPTQGFAVGFNTFNNGGGDANSNNSMNLTFNNGILALSPTDLTPLGFDLATGTNGQRGVFHHAFIDLFLGGPTPNVTIQLTDGNSGAVITPFNNFSLAGVNVGGIPLGPYDGRVGFATRTGDSSESVDLDNLNVRFEIAGVGAIAEPGTLAMLGFGFVGLGFMGRRRVNA